MTVNLTAGTLIQSTIATGYTPRWMSQVYATDLNRDGNSDLVIVGASYPSDGTPVAQPGLVAFGDGKGGYTPATETQFPVSTLRTVHPREVIFDDLNGDGRPDVFIASHGYDASPFPGEQNRLYLSSANGTWRDASANLPQVSDFSHGASAADINGDGHIDIVVGNVPLPNPVQPYVLLNDGTGRFTRNDTILPTGTGQILNGYQTRMTAELLFDLDQDGRADLVAGSFDSTTSQTKPPFILWNQQGSYSASNTTTLPLPRHFGATNSVYDIQSWDVNQDGRPDLLLAYQQSVSLGGWELQVLINDGNHSFSDQTSRYIPEESAQYGGFPSAASAVSQYWVQFIKPMDLNSDGRMDFVLDARGSTSAPSTLPVAYVQQADGSFQTARVSDIAGSQSWLFDYSTQAVTWTGQTGFTKVGLSNGTLTAYTLPVSFAPVQPTILTSSTPVTRWGTTGNDTLYGGAGNDRFTGEAGNDRVDGGDGIDTSVYRGNRADYTLQRTDSGYTVSSTGEGADTLVGIERLQFSDVSLGLDISGNTGKTAKILGAVYGPSALSNKAYVGIGLAFLDAGMSYETLLGLALQGTSAKTPAQIVDLLWTNVMGSAPTTAQAQPFIDLLNAGMPASRLGVLAADAPQNAERIDLTGLPARGLEYTPWSLS